MKYPPLSPMPVLTKHPMFHDPAYPSEVALSAAQMEKIDSFNEKISAGEIEFESAPCPCGGDRFELITEFDRYRVWQPIVVCTECGLVQCQPRLTEPSLQWFYSSDFFREAYNGDILIPMTDAKFERLARGGRQRYERILEHLPSSKIGSVGEVGCAAGWNLYPFHEAGIPIMGADFGPHMIEFGKTKGMDLRVGDMSAFGDAKFDLLILSHVIEHVLDLDDFMARALCHLNPGGHVYVEVPDIADFCMGAFQTAHIYYFSMAHMDHLCARFGLASLATRNIGPFFYGVYHADADASRAVPPPDEYARVRASITKFERREWAKGLLRRTGLFPLCRYLVNLVR